MINKKNNIDINNLVENPCYVTGFCRSGTNLLNRLLDGHFELLSPPGVGKIHSLRKLYYLDWNKMNKKEIFNTLANHLEYKIGSYNYKLLLNKIRPYLKNNSTYKEVLIAIIKGTIDYSSYDLSKAKIWIEKNHNNEFYLQNALKSFLNPKFIFITRDPRDIWISWKLICRKEKITKEYKQFYLNINLHLIEEFEAMASGYGRFPDLKLLCRYHRINYNSFLKMIDNFYSTGRNLKSLRKATFNHKFFKFSDTEEGRFAWNYKYILNKALYNAEKYPKYFMIIKYENVILKTEETMNKIAGFLNINFEKIMLAPTEQGGAWASNTSYNEKYKKISSNSIGKYKNNIPENTREVLESLFKKEMRIFGYK